MTPKIEIILCAAIWYKKLESQHYLPKNIDKGVVVCGHRHSHCIYITLALSGKRTVTFAEDGTGEFEQGFITNMNRFVGRQEALKIALKENQTDKNDLCNPKIGLFSEDLY